MKRLILAFSLAFLIGLFAVSGFAMTAYAFDNSPVQAQLTSPGSYQTVAWHRYYRDRYYRDYDGPYYQYGYYDPYYYDYPYPYTYYYGPGFGVDVPFFHFRIY